MKNNRLEETKYYYYIGIDKFELKNDHEESLEDKCNRELSYMTLFGLCCIIIYMVIIIFIL